MGCGLTLNFVVSNFSSSVLLTWLIASYHGEAGLSHWVSRVGHVLIWSTRRNGLGSAYMRRSAKECGGAQGRNNRPQSKGVDLHVTCMPGWDVAP